jgi:WD40 repeat protein
MCQYQLKFTDCSLVASFHRIWDARKLQNMPVGLLDQGAQDNAMGGTLDFEVDVVNEYASGASGKGLFRAEYPHYKSVSSAHWDPRGRQIVSTSYDDTLRRKLISSWVIKMLN